MDSSSDDFALHVKILWSEHWISSRGCEALDFQEFQKMKDDFEIKADKYCLGDVNLPYLTTQCLHDTVPAAPTEIPQAAILLALLFLGTQILSYWFKMAKYSKNCGQT